MNKPGLTGIVLASFFLLTACAHHTCPPPTATAPDRDMWHETWQQYLSVSPSQWAQGGDSWYFSGEPNRTERQFAKMPLDQSVTVAAVRVPFFTDVRINGCFQTQITGNQDRNSLFVAGTNEAIRQIPVDIEGRKIYIGQTPGPACLASLRHVIVRIGVHNLKNLAIYGDGPVEGRNIASSNLTIKAAGNGNTLLAGDLQVRKILLTGNGTLTVLGVNTPDLVIEAPGNGNIRVRGDVGVSYIHHSGNGNINILGANSDHLVLCTAGSGMTTIRGIVNLRTVTASDNSQVYVSGTDSSYIRIRGSNNAQIGLNGRADSTEISLQDCARYWGANLQSRIVYVNTQNGAHANVKANGRLFARATDDSSIFYDSRSRNVSQFTAGNAVILPMGDFIGWKPMVGWTQVYK